jgi:uncharacterized protein YqgV (UPF0045/DUF77 family)
MQTTAELSLYPLTENYATVVTDYILEFEKYSGIEIEVNGLSTQLFGEYELVWKAVQEVTRKLFEEQRAVLVMKIAGAELKKENLPDELKK